MIALAVVVVAAVETAAAGVVAVAVVEAAVVGVVVVVVGPAQRGPMKPAPSVRLSVPKVLILPTIRFF